MSMEKCACPKEKMLFGFPEYEVRNAADDITRANELQEVKPALYEAALKLLEKRQKVTAGIIIAARKGKKNGGQ